jgi:hypothetical protein
VSHLLAAHPIGPFPPDRIVRYISFGAGVQSTALVVMSALGLRGCPRADAAIFADTQDEPPWVYEQLRAVAEWARPHGLMVWQVTAGQLSNAGEAFLRIPAFTEGDDGRPSMLRRQCTREFKIVPIQRAVRKMLGYEPRQRIKHRVEALIGISRDEIQRMRVSDEPWVTNRYPLIDAGMYRGNCLTLIREHGLPEPRKSACVFCPYHDNDFWRTLKEQHPAQFETAAQYDERIRDSTKAGVSRPAFLHRSLLPLRQVDFTKPETGQLDFGFQNECEGMCGV